MPLIHLTTFIAAPIEKVFSLSLSIDLHQSSMARYKEKAVDGRLSGIINKGETVTWKAYHLFKERTLKVKITYLQKPYLFIDEQVEGDFKMMKHEHHFKGYENGTLLIDRFQFPSPYGIIGGIVDKLYLKKYMQRLLEKRNNVIKEVAETE